MRYLREHLLVAFTALGLLTGFITQKQLTGMHFHENEMIKKLRQLFETYTEARPADRIYLQFDKPIYEPGETIWFHAYLRNAQDMGASQKSDILYVELINPKGTVEKTLKLIAQQGVANGDFDISENMPGGLYKVKAYTSWQSNDAKPFFYEREIQVQKSVLPRLKMKLDFERKGYGPGERVVAILDLQSLDNQPLSNKECAFKAQLKGAQFADGKATSDANGQVRISFELPKKMDTADGLLNILLQHNGQTESISRSLPLATRKITFDIFPEGGDLVVGHASQVGFRAVDEFGKPADVEGVIIDGAGREVASFSSFHRGLGAFAFKPEQGMMYQAKITRPAGIETTYPMPKPLELGYTVTLKENTAERVVFEVQSSVSEELSMAGQVRGFMYYTNSFKVEKGKTFTLEIPASQFPMGVAQFTLFDSYGIERAERLAFLNKHKQLNIEITTNKERYMPREQVSLDIRVTDERGIGMPAQLSMAVVDDKQLSFADDRQGHILSKMLLEPDLQREVFEPNFYFDPKEAKADKALDVLMMTEGWRKFSWEEARAFLGAAPQYPSERAIVKGLVIDPSGKPVSGAKVTGNGVDLGTDANGNFYIKGLLLYESLFLDVRKENLQGTAVVSEYGEDLVIEIREPMIYRSAMKANAGAAGEGFGGGGDDWGGDEMIMDEAPMPVMAPATEVVDAVQVMDVREEPAKEEVAKPAEKAKEMDADIADDFGADLEEFADEEPVKDQRLAAPQENTYYRARTFAAPVYDSAQATPAQRTDFRNTIYWQGGIATDRNGRAHITFYNSDAITAFRATVEGIGGNGFVGRKEHLFYTQKPLSMDVKIPTAVTMGDEVMIPLTVANRSGKGLEGQLFVSAPESWALIGTPITKIPLGNGDVTTIYLKYRVGNMVGKGKLAVSFGHPQSGVGDSFEQEVTVAPKGFPVALSGSGNQMQGAYDFDVVNPVAGTMQAQVAIYPTALSDMLAGIESILAEPYGCFEQTSSSTYPNIMVLQYLKEADVQNPQVHARATELIDRGYKRLIAYETSEKGYEWFGGAPGHEALSAYGLMEFQDMALVYNGVDQGMVKRTANWLFEKRDGNGGFKRNDRALDSFGGASDAVTNAYIVYALSEAGYSEQLRKELDKAYNTALAEQDPYQYALLANALFNMKDLRAIDMLAKLNATQNGDGAFTGKTHSITRSTGEALTIETTALAIMANLRAENRNGGIIDKATRRLLAMRSPYGGFGNTQSTVMALKALTAFAKYAKRTAESGDVEVLIDGKSVAQLHFEADEQGPMVMANLGKYLEKPGKHKVEVRFKNMKEALPHAVSVRYSTLQPNSSKDCVAELSVSLSQKTARMGETVRCLVSLKNKTAEGQPMTMAIVGIPAGLSAQPWQLKELQEKGAFDYYEIIGNELAIYYRQMKPSERKEIALDLKADIPGEYEGAASRTYLYYTNEHKQWQEGLRVKISE